VLEDVLACLLGPLHAQHLERVLLLLRVARRIRHAELERSRRAEQDDELGGEVVDGALQQAQQ
jgi:hypothetical protein